MSSDEPDYSDVLIIGAGFSGIGAAYRIREKNPGLSYTLGPVPLPRHSVRQRHLHAVLPVGAMDAIRDDRRR